LSLTIHSYSWYPETFAPNGEIGKEQLKICKEPESFIPSKETKEVMNEYSKTYKTFSESFDLMKRLVNSVRSHLPDKLSRWGDLPA